MRQATGRGNGHHSATSSGVLARPDDQPAEPLARPSASPEMDPTPGKGAVPSAAARAVREKARRQRLNDMCGGTVIP